eukprot:5646909-Pyramimonas_sp.AAC.1
MASKTALEHSRRAPSRLREAPQTASDGPPRRPKMARRRPKRLPRGLPGRADKANIIDFP